MRVLIVCGGRSAEHEISLISGRFVLDSLGEHEPVVVAIDRAGVWRHLSPDALPRSKDPRAVEVPADAPEAWLRPSTVAGGAGVLCVGDEQIPFDIAVPVLHGPFGEDGCSQGLFELAGVPYVGSGVPACAVGMHKVMQKQVFRDAELPVVRYHAFGSRAWRLHRDEQIETCAELGYPVFVKPVNMGSSQGVRKARDDDELVIARSDQHAGATPLER